MGGGSQRLLCLNPTTVMVVLLLGLWLLLGCDNYFTPTSDALFLGLRRVGFKTYQAQTMRFIPWHARQKLICICRNDHDDFVSVSTQIVLLKLITLVNCKTKVICAQKNWSNLQKNIILVR